MKLIRILVLATFCVSWTQANAQKNIPALEREAHNVTIIRDNGAPTKLPLLSKRDVAERILDEVEQALS